MEEDKLFATLDTTTRNVTLLGGSNIYLTDTVGFVQKLSHHLVEAFKATLEELKFADILLHVVDASDENRVKHMEVVYSTLRDLGCGEKPVITVFNKMDKEVEMPLPQDKNCCARVEICAKNQKSLENLLDVTEEVLKSFRKPMKVLIPYTEGSLLAVVHGKCEIISEEHTENGTLIEAYMTDEAAGRLEKYKVE